MIDIHCHLLPGIDDGAPDLESAREMARMAAADGISTIACTPHFMTGVYDTRVGAMTSGLEALASDLARHAIDLRLVGGGDIHASPDLVQRLDTGDVPTIADSRYFLFEPPHHIVLPNIVRLVRALVAQGYVPVLTHPERLTWIEPHYDIVCAMEETGAAVQLTAGSITGGFGRRARYWSERMLEEGRVDVIASDAHNTTSRPPVMSRACDAVATRLGEETAAWLSDTNPRCILDNGVLPARRRTRTDAPPPRRARRSWLGALLKQPR